MTRIAYTGLLAATLVTLASSRLAAQADPPIDTTRWVLVGISGDSSSQHIYIDTTTVRRTGDTVTVWAQDRFPHPEQANGGISYTRIVRRIAIDCAQSQFLMLIAIEYDGPKVALTLSRAELEAAMGGWAPIPPGTIIEGESEFACSLPHRAAP